MTDSVRRRIDALICDVEKPNVAAHKNPSKFTRPTVGFWRPRPIEVGDYVTLDWWMRPAMYEFFGRSSRTSYKIDSIHDRWSPDGGMIIAGKIWVTFEEANNGKYLMSQGLLWSRTKYSFSTYRKA